MNYKMCLFSGLFAFFFLLSVSPVQSMNGDPDPSVDIKALETKADFEQAYEVLKDRVDQLKIDKKVALTKDEKQQVKEQIKKTKNEINAIKAKALSGGIYIGSGVLIVLIVLLLLL